MPRPYVTGEDVPRVVEALRSKLGPKAMKLNLDSLVKTRFEEVPEI